MRTSVVHALVLLMLPVLAGAATFTPLGTLPGGVSSVPFATSADGAVVVGESDDGTSTQAFSWTGGVMTGLGFIPGGSASSAQGVSADGTVVVGVSSQVLVVGGLDTTVTQAFRWTGGVMTGLGTLPGDSNSGALDVSADGSVVVGHSDLEDGSSTQAFRWTGDVMTGLGFLEGDTSSIASGVSADGGVVVGESSHVVPDPDGDITVTQAVSWTGGVITGLGTLDGGSTSVAFDVSADGSVVVGESDDGENTQAFRWTAGGMTGLGFLGETDSTAQAVSDDGSVIVGQSGGQAFIWTEADGMQPLASVLIAGGATGLNFATLYAATGISADGLSVVGQRSPSAFVATYSPADLGLVPDPFAFTDVADVAVSTEIKSDVVTISGISGATPVTVYGGEYSVGCGTEFTSDPGTINDGETICVRQTSAATAATNTNTILTVGGVSAMFTSRTGGSSGGSGPSGSSAMDGLSLLALGLIGLLRRRFAS